MVDRVKDLASSLQWLGLLLRLKFHAWPQELPYAGGVAKKKILRKDFDWPTSSHVPFIDSFH